MIHGGDIYTKGLLEGRELIDYSSNVNPLGVPKSFVNNIEKAIVASERYPDIQYRELKKALSKYTGVDTSYFMLGNGAAEILDLSIALLDSVLLAGPSFSEYRLSAEKYNSKITYSVMQERAVEGKLVELDYDYIDIKEKLSEVSGLVLANPNNPNGNVIDINRFKEILDICEREEKIVIIDEAFIEFVEDAKSLIELIDEYKCLIIVRALTKFYGVPGIRFGYGMTSNKELKKKIEEKQNPWNINSFAEECAKTVLFDEEYIQVSKQWIKDEREAMTNMLLELSIIKKVYKTNANYVLVELKDYTAQELYAKCLEKGYAIRIADNYIGLEENHVRFAIKNKELNKLFIKMLKTI